MAAILSLSLLTVMAGAAVAPALGVISAYFSDEPEILVKLIISMPALCIAVTNLFFGRLCRYFRVRTLSLAGLAMYVVFGCAAGVCSNIYVVLACRALLGVGVGIIMPMSTGLITFYFTRDKHEALMGYSSAMNMLGGVVATLIAGGMAMISWRLSFAVYLLGFVSIIPVILWMPNEKIADNGKGEKQRGVIRQYYPYIAGMFMLMLLFFNYPANFALESSRSGVVTAGMIPVIMALMDVFGFFGGIAFSKFAGLLGGGMKYVAPLMFLVGYICLDKAAGIVLVMAGSFVVGAAIGIGVPNIISTASAKAGDKAAVTVIPALSVALYLSQFAAPAIMAAVQICIAAVYSSATTYTAAAAISVILILWSRIFCK